MTTPLPVAAPTETDRWWRSRGFYTASAAGGFLVLLFLKRVIHPGTTASLWMTWSLVSAWFCGRAVGLSLTIAALAISAGLNPSDSEPRFIMLAMTWGLNIGLILWITEIKRQHQAEFHLARHDPLTGVANRQAIVERCHAELCRAKRFQRPLSIVLLDGDNFKSINDRYGHPTGDMILCRTTAALSETVRQYDLVGRLGGDEFVILLPEVTADDAKMVVKRLQAALEARVEHMHPSLSYSIGVVTLLPGAWEVDDCLDAADRALYAAKTKGGKSVHFATVQKSATVNHPD